MDEIPPSVPPQEATSPLAPSSFNTWVYVLGGLAFVLVIGIIVAFLMISRETVTIKEYGTDLAGFMKAVETCEPARIVYTTTIDMTIFNFNQTSTSLYELKGMNGTTCTMYTELLNSSRTFASELPPEMVARNLEVDAQMRGLNNTCYYSLEALAQMFLSLQAGNFSIGTDVESDIVCEHQGWQEITLPAQTTFPEDTAALPPSDSLLPPASNSFFSENSTSFQQTCLENWVCTQWSECSGGIRSRTCEDGAHCGNSYSQPSLYNASGCVASSQNTAQNQTNGACGVPYPNCASGNSVPLMQNKSGFYWKCEGIPGGNNASCSEEGDYTLLEVTKGGNGFGTVVDDWHGQLNCGQKCFELYPHYTSPLLTPTPNPGSVFSHWIGLCSSVGGPNTCTIYLNIDRNVTAIFNQTSA